MLVYLLQGDPEKRDHPQSASWKEVLMLLEEKGLEVCYKQNIMLTCLTTVRFDGGICSVGLNRLRYSDLIAVKTKVVFGKMSPQNVMSCHAICQTKCHVNVMSCKMSPQTSLARWLINFYCFRRDKMSFRLRNTCKVSWHFRKVNSRSDIWVTGFRFLNSFQFTRITFSLYKCASKALKQFEKAENDILIMTLKTFSKIAVWEISEKDKQRTRIIFQISFHIFIFKQRTVRKFFSIVFVLMADSKAISTLYSIIINTTTRELWFEWSHLRISSRYWNIRTVLYCSVNSITGNYVSGAFFWTGTL